MTDRIPTLLDETNHYAGAAMRAAGVEYHAVVFQPLGDAGGIAPCVAVEIPEAERGLTSALEQARRLRARVIFLCNTADQADAIAERAGRLLPQHRRVSLDRAASTGWKLDA